MRDPPAASQLLDLATAVLARGADEAERRRAQRCIEIAAREQSAGDGAYAEIARSLARLYGVGDATSLLRRLAFDIRAGRFDAAGPHRAGILCLLRALVVQRLRESNPGFLASTDFDAEPPA